MKKKFIIISASVLLLLLLIFSMFYIDFIGTGGDGVTVTIPKGAGAKEIASILKENHIIKFPFLFTKYVSDDAAHLTAGVHNFTKNMGYKNVLSELKKDVPAENAIQITVPEGYEVREIAALLEKNNIVTTEDFLSACWKAHEKYSFLPDDGNVEGYLFPATYSFQIESDAEKVVSFMVETFTKKLYTEENIKKAEEMGLSFHEALTLASIIEREAAIDSERETISSVFHNRLKIGMKLQSCATVQYVLKERKDVLSIADTEIDSPYNTYQNEGLPPTPIASPGEKSFSAALHPTDTDFLFFVADGTGGHKFSETFDEHEKAAQ